MTVVVLVAKGDRLSQSTEDMIWKAPCRTFFSVTSRGSR